MVTQVNNMLGINFTSNNPTPYNISSITIPPLSRSLAGREPLQIMKLRSHHNHLAKGKSLSEDQYLAALLPTFTILFPMLTELTILMSNVNTQRAT